MIRSERIALRLPEPDDHPLLASWCNDPTLTPYFYADEPVSLESHLKWYEGVKNDPTQRFFVIEALVDPTDGDRPGLRRPIGCVGLLHIEPIHRRAEYGRLKIGDVRYRSGGFGREAENAIMRYGFDVLNLNRIWCEVLDDNEKVIAMHERTGFKVEGFMRAHVWKGGDYRMVVVMGLLRKDWERLNLNAKEKETGYAGVQ